MKQQQRKLLEHRAIDRAIDPTERLAIQAALNRIGELERKVRWLESGRKPGSRGHYVGLDVEDENGVLWHVQGDYCERGKKTHVLSVWSEDANGVEHGQELVCDDNDYRNEGWGTFRGLPAATADHFATQSAAESRRSAPDAV